MDSRVKLLQVIDAVGELRGAKKLHKILYLAQVLGYGVNEDFVWHWYGPYSPSIALKIEDLVNTGALEESRAKAHYETRSFQLTPEGQQLIEVFGKEGQQEDALRDLVATLYGKWSARRLELIASIMYLQRSGRTRGAAIREVKQSKEKFTTNELRQALEDIAALVESFTIEGRSEGI